MTAAPFQSNRWWYAAEVVLTAAVVALPLAIGGAPEWSLWLLMVLSLAKTKVKTKVFKARNRGMGGSAAIWL